MSSADAPSVFVESLGSSSSTDAPIVVVDSTVQSAGHCQLSLSCLSLGRIVSNSFLTNTLLLLPTPQPHVPLPMPTLSSYPLSEIINNLWVVDFIFRLVKVCTCKCWARYSTLTCSVYIPLKPVNV